MPGDTSVSTLHGLAATRPSVALWTKAAPEPEGFSYTHLDVRIFLKTAVAARGREGGLFIPTVYTGPFGITVFLEFSSGSGCVIEPAIF